MSEHILYTILAKYYDVIYREYLEQHVPRLVDAYEHVFQRYAKREIKDILDVACGTAGPSLELAKRGYKVTGVDLHEEVINIAREKAKKQGLEIVFRIADARDLDKVLHANRFDAATMFFSSINYMTSLSDLERLLKAINHVLHEGGVFVADAPSPYYSVYRHGSQGLSPITWHVESPETGEHLFILDWREVRDYAQGIVKLMRLISILDNKGNQKTYLVSDTLRYYTPLELELVAKNAGFTETYTLCYEAGRPIELDKATRCPRMIFIATKT